jgi:hypothetical protein
MFHFVIYFLVCEQLKRKEMSLSLKRKRGPGAAVLDAAQKGGSIARTEFIDHMKNLSHPRSRIAQMNAYIPKGRSAVRHVLKGAYKHKFVNRSTAHVHDVMRKFNRGRPVNGVKAFMQIIK